MATTVDLFQYDVQLSDVPSKQVTLSADGAVDLALLNMGSSYFITKGSAAAITLAAPIAGSPMYGGHDGLRITFVAATAFAHTVTNSSPGFNNAGAAQDVATAAGALGNHFTVEARNGVWWTVGNVGFTLA